MGGGPKANSNVPIVDVPKWLWRGVSGLIGTMSLNTVFFLKASLINFRLSIFIPNDHWSKLIPFTIENDTLTIIYNIKHY